MTTESTLSLTALRQLARERIAAEASLVSISPQALEALVYVASVAKRRILGEYAPGVSLPSRADYWALSLALSIFEFDWADE